VKGIISRLGLILLAVCLLSSCNANDGVVDEPVESYLSQGAEGAASQKNCDDEILFFPNQDVAITAHQNMLAYFDAMSYSDIDKFPDDFGGCYINDRNVLTINVVNPDEESIALYEEACGEPIEIAAVSYTLKELLETQRIMRDFLKNDESELYSVALNEVDNRLDALMNKSASEEISLLLDDFPYINISTPDTSLTLSKYGDTPSDGDVLIIPEFPIYDPGVEYIDFVMHNNGKGELMYGAGDYEVDVLLDGVWYNIPMKPMAFTSIGYILNPNSHRYRRVNLSFFDYRFASGKYRVVQKFDGRIYFGYFELGKSNITAETPHGFAPLKDLPAGYSLDMARADGCIILGEVSTYNRVIKFLDKVCNGMPAMIRIASVSSSGDFIISDVEYGFHPPNSSTMQPVYAFSCSQKSPSGVITEEILSFLTFSENDNMFEILLSNYRSVSDNDYVDDDYDNANNTFTILSFEDGVDFEGITDIKVICEQIEEKYRMSSNVRFGIYSESGLYVAGLFSVPLEFSVSKPGRGELFTLPEGMADEISSLKWISEGRLLLIGTIDGIPNKDIAVFNAELWDFE
jgi:hypothetical protein